MHKKPKQGEPMALTYSWEGNDTFVVRFDAKKISAFLRNGEARFVATTNTARFEVI
jgi:hypothetical protein